MSRRYLALSMPWLPLDRLCRLEPALRGHPLATWATHGPRRQLEAADAPGLSPGQALADAQALQPEVVLYPAAPEEDAALLEQLALWAMRFTPLVAVDGGEGLLLDTTGAAALLGGEARFVATVAERFRQDGFRLRAAMASTAGAAAALARESRTDRIIPPGQEREAIAPLSLLSLRLPPDMIRTLGRMGLHRIGQVCRQPRGPLARRFGRVLLDALDHATGDRPQPLQPVRPPAAFLAARNCLEPIVTRPAIDRIVDALLAEICRSLLEAGRGARRLVLRAFRVDRVVQEIVIGTGAPSREPLHLRRLFAEKLERLEPDLGFERLTLEAAATDLLGGHQAALAGHAGTDTANTAALAELLDRLSQRVSVHRMKPMESHWPEYAAVAAAPYDTTEVPAGWGHETRPVRLLGHPVALAVTAELPDGLPAQLRYGQVLHRVLHCIGPERLEPEWWGADAARPSRDYFRVQTAEGPRLWICRLGEPGPLPPRWFLHGYLA
jgi:protein ImuB